MTAAVERAEHHRRPLVALVLAVLALVVGVALDVDAHASTAGAQVLATRVAAHEQLAGPVVAASADIDAGEGRGATTQAADVAIGSRVAPQTTRTVTMGRNMSERAIPYAEQHGYDWYHGTPRWVPRRTIERISPGALERTDLWFNRRWIRGEMRGGSRIVDIGEPPGYRPSDFYNMERGEVSGCWNYFEDFQP